MYQKLLDSVVFVAAVLASTTAAAAVCVQVDQQRDNLKPTERKAVKTMVEDSLRRQDLEVSSQGCSTTYTIYSLKLGNSVTANISGPDGSRTQKAHNLEELPETYDQITAALIQGTEGQTAGVTRDNVTKKQAAPRRVVADSLFYARLGYGGVIGGDIAGGPAFGFGWRYELDHVGIDISGANFALVGDHGADPTFTLLRLGGLFYFDGTSNNTPYAGAALSYGFTGVYDKIGVQSGRDVYGTYAGSGLQGELSVGYEFLRASTIRMFVEANAVLPFYTADPDGYPATGADSMYTPSATISLGLGYDSSPTQSIEVYE